MYEAILIKNDKDEYMLNSISTSRNAPHITGTIKQGINSFDSFTFTIYSTHPQYNNIVPFRSKIKVTNTKNNKVEFLGRVLTNTEELKENGLYYVTYICESELAFLRDSIVFYNTFENYTVKQYLEHLINVHNKNVSANYTNKDFVIGNIEFTDTMTFTNDYGTIWENINKNLLDVLGGELQLRYVDGIRYLDYVKKIGVKSDVKICLGRNIKDLKRDWKFDDFATSFIPLGKKLDNSERRVNITSVNNGNYFIHNVEGRKKYGIIEKILIFDDIETPEELLKTGQDYVNSVVFNSSLSLTALELFYLGLDSDTFEVGNQYRVIADIFSIDYIARVIEKEIDINDPLNNKLTFDEKDIDIKAYNYRKTKKISNNVETTSKKLNSADYISKSDYDEFVKTTNDKIKELEDIISQQQGGDTNV